MKGNLLSTYSQTANIPSPKFEWEEQHLYGSSRLGLLRPAVSVHLSAPKPNANYNDTMDVSGDIGRRVYELSNHLGNVMATISDKRLSLPDLPACSLGCALHYEAEILSAQDYYPGGMIMPGRQYSTSSYRYGFNGKENDNELKGEGNSLDFDARIYDTRIGRFLSLDILEKKYPAFSAYSYPYNNPIMFRDKDGKEGVISVYIQNENGSRTLLAVKHVEGHTFKTETRTEYMFKGTQFQTSSLVDYKQAYDYTQEIVIDAKTMKITYGQQQATGNMKAEASGLWAETRADNKAGKQDQGKGLLQSFKIRNMTDFEEFVERTFSKEETVNMYKTFGSIYSPSPDASGGDDRVLVSKSTIQAARHFMQILNDVYKKQSGDAIFCETCNANFEANIDGSTSNTKTSTPAKDTVPIHGEKRKSASKNKKP